MPGPALFKVNETEKFTDFAQVLERGAAVQALSIEGDVPAFPARISELTGLKQLFLQQCGWDSLPAEIGSMAQLEYLSLDFSTLKAVPPEVGSLSNLKTLYITPNSFLTSLPPELGKLTKLEMLSVGHCPQLATLPDELCRGSRGSPSEPTCRRPRSRSCAGWSARRKSPL